jgi:hypothetical protein
MTVLSSQDFRLGRRTRAYELIKNFDLDIYLPETALDEELERAVQTELLAKLLIHIRAPGESPG